MHDAAWKWAQQWAPDRPVSVIDIGGRDINGSPRRLFDPAGEYLSIDLHPGPGVDVVADFTEWRGDPVDVVVCMEVAEHTPQWADLLCNARDHLHPGGLLIFTAATDPRAPHSANDGGPLADGEWYQNIDPDVLDRELAQLFAAWEIDVTGEDIRAAAWR